MQTSLKTCNLLWRGGRQVRDWRRRTHGRKLLTARITRTSDVCGMLSAGPALLRERCRQERRCNENYAKNEGVYLRFVEHRRRRVCIHTFHFVFFSSADLWKKITPHFVEKDKCAVKKKKTHPLFWKYSSIEKVLKCGTDTLGMVKRT